MSPKNVIALKSNRKNKVKRHHYWLFCFLLGVSQSAFSDDGKAQFYKVETFPKTISSNCRGGIAKVYDECGSQMDIVRAAFKRALETNKTLLMVYGAEWCIWCHVFDKYIQGEHKNFSYEWEYSGEIKQWDMQENANRKAGIEAKILNKYVAENFIVVHVEGHFAPDGLNVIDAIGFDRKQMNFFPFIFSINKAGLYASHMLAYNAIPGLEIRKDSGKEYRGFDRAILLKELKKLKAAAELSNTKSK